MKGRRAARSQGQQEQGPKTGIGELFDIPQAVSAGQMQIELSGNTEAVIGGCTGVLEYDEHAIRIVGGKLSVRFTGRGLQLKALTQDSAIVQGFILGMEFTS